MTTNRVLLFGLNHTTDVTEAEHLADQLPYDMHTADPQVCFSPAWVLRHSKDKVEVASFAVEYCDDPATLDKIARRENRVAVLQRLASNRHLSEDTYEILLRRASNSAHHRIVRARERVIAAENYVPPTVQEQFETFLATKKNFDLVANRYGADAVERSLKAFEKEIPGATEKFLTTAATLGYGSVIETFLASYYEIEHGNGTLWVDVQLKPEQVVSLLEGEALKGVLTWFATRLTRWNPLEEPSTVDHEMIQLMISHVDPKRIRFHAPGSLPLFTKEAIELLMNEPSWFGLLALCPLDDDQFTRFLTQRSGDQAVSLFNLLQGNRDRLELLLDTLAPGLTLDRYAVGLAIDVLSDANDPLLERIIAVGHDIVRAAYLCGEFLLEGQSLLCAPEDVSYHVELLSENADAAVTLYDWLTSRLANYSPEYLGELLEHVPGLANYAVQRDVCASEYVYERLVSTKADLAICLDQLDRAGDVSLAKLCSTLKILAKQS